MKEIILPKIAKTLEGNSQDQTNMTKNQLEGRWHIGISSAASYTATGESWVQILAREIAF